MLLNTSELFGTPTLLVMDPVHEGIPFFAHERLIINHPLFQRLRHIKQTDVLCFVFPGTTHSRFEHCLGTMHVAGRIFQNMIRNYLGNSNISKLNSDIIDAIQYCYGCLRIAALLHDVGHLPFSHQFEKSPAGKKLLTDSEIITKLWNKDCKKYLKATPTEMSHELLSISCACEILKTIERPDHFPFKEIDIVGMMETSDVVPSKKFCDSTKKIIKLFAKDFEKIEIFSDQDIGKAMIILFKDIISGEIDADKMDYLLRDSYFSGSRYGTYNLDHLAKNICVGYDLDDFSVPWIGIAINQKGLAALEDFVYSRYRMYLQVYNHKAVTGFKWLVQEAMSEILKEDIFAEYIRSYFSDLKNLSNLTDTYFWECFRKYADKNPESACGYLVHRKRLLHKQAIMDVPDFEKRKIKKELEKKLGKKIIQYESPTKFSKINPSFAKIRLLKKDELTHKFHLEGITRNSTFFSKFSDVVETHYYEAPSFYHA